MILFLALSRVLPDDSVSYRAPVRARHLPTSVNAPAAWSSDEYQRGPVAALGLAKRMHTDGIVGDRQSLDLYAVSAVDGRPSWIRLPGFAPEMWDIVSGFAVSPDGEWIGWVRPLRSSVAVGGRVSGWSVMNTTSGRIRRLQDPNSASVLTGFVELKFSGDSRHLLTSYDTANGNRGPKSRGAQFVAWDVKDGTRTIIEQPGPSGAPNLGSAPSGVAWSRGRETFRADPVTGSRTSVTLPHLIHEASWGPDDTSFAYIGDPAGSQPTQLYAGRTIAEARRRPVNLRSPVGAEQILGWVDSTHVVIGHHNATAQVVDVESGGVRAVDMDAPGELASVPYLASGLWANPLITPVPPGTAADPRRPWWWASGAVLIVFAGALLVRRRRQDGVEAVPAEDVAQAMSQRADATASIDPVVVQPQHYSAYDGQTTAMRPLRRLGTAATGLIIVLLDFRIQGVDLIPDPIGWVMAALALCSLRPLHGSFYVAGVAAWLAVIPALPEWVGVEGSLITVLTDLALVVVEVATCTALMTVSPARGTTAYTIRWLSVALSATSALALLATSVEPSALILAVVIGLADLIVTAWFLLVLYRVAGEDPAYGVEMLPV